MKIWVALAALLIALPAHAQIINPGGGGGGSGTVTSVGAGCGTSTGGAAITTTGNVVSIETYAAQTGTNYAFANADCGTFVKLSNGSAQTPTIAAAGSGGNFTSGWYVDVCNAGAGTQTITPTTSTIDGAATLALTNGQCVTIVSDGTNYQVAGKGLGGSSTPCTTTALSVQFNSAGSFGCVTEWTYASHLMTVTQATANTGILASTGYSLTGSGATSMVSLAGTINTSGVPEVFKLAMTTTAAAAGSNILALYAGVAGASPRFFVDFNGNVGTVGNSIIGAGGSYSFGTLTAGGGINNTKGGMEALADGQFGFFDHTGGKEAVLNIVANGNLAINGPSSANGMLSLNATALTLTAGAFGVPKMTASGSAPGASGAKMEWVCGTNSGSLKMIIIAGTSATAVTVCTS